MRTLFPLTSASRDRGRAGRRSVRAIAALAVAGLLVTAVGCSTISTSGVPISEPAHPLDAALQQLKRDNSAAIEQGSTTIARGTNCFYQRIQPDADDVTAEVACGPIRRLGRTDEQVWDIYRVTYTQTADGNLTGAVDRLIETGTAADPALLVSARPDTAPLPVGQVPEPKAPPTAVTNQAMMLRSSSAAANGLSEFTELKQPALLRTPAVDLEVTAMAEPKTLPKELFAGQKDGDDAAPAYRPADGQIAYAFQVKTGPGTSADELLSTSADSRIKVLATKLSVAAGEESIAIRDQSSIPNVADAKTLTVPCQAADGGSFPCTSDRAGEGVLLMTVPEGAEPSLVAEVGGSEQSVDLTTSKLTSEVSRVEYERSELTQQLDTTLEAGPLKETVQSSGTGKSKDKKKDDKTVKGESSWRMDVDAAGLTAFDPYRGWAPDGKAWLVVATSDYRQAGKEYKSWATSRADSLSVTVDGTSIKPDGLTGVDGADVNWIFQIPADATTVTLKFQPTGTFTGGKKDKEFRTKSAAGYEIKLPS